MKKKVFWKDIRKAVVSSKGRFLSIMSLMALGSFALVGLKVTAPDMHRTAHHYLAACHTMDLSVIASQGLSQEDQEELEDIPRSQVEYAYMTDVTIKNQKKAVRIFSNSKHISVYELVGGRMPKAADEIALASTLKKDYQLGDTISFTQSGRALLGKNSYKVVGFVNSPEIWSTTNMGRASAGDGALSAYAVATESAFVSSFYTLARLTYDDLADFSSFSSAYRQKLAAHQDDLDNLLADNGQKRLLTLQGQLQQQITAAQKEVDAAKEEVAEQEGALSFLSGTQLDTAQTALSEAKHKIALSEEQLKDMQKTAASMEEPIYNTYNRSTFPGGGGYQTYVSGTASISAIGNIFPVVLYLVAALVTFTTMARFVDEERTNSGILKALGYSDLDVIKKFTVYGLSAGLFGTVIGVISGTYLLAEMVSETLTSSLTIGSTHLYFYWDYTVLAFFLAMVSAVLPAYLVARRELSEKPAQLLLAKPPVKGAKIFLERLTFVWRHLTFTQKVTVRNIFRYKQRMFMTVFGVAGSVALLFAGLGIQSTLREVIDNQFGRITPYDILVTEDKTADRSAKKTLQDYLAAKEVAATQAVYLSAFDEKIDGIDDKQSISLLATEEKDFADFIHLFAAESGKEIKLPDNGAVISEKLASLYKVKTGDSIYLKAANQTVKLRISAVVEMTVGHYLFLSKDYYEKTFSKTFSSNAYLLSLRKSDRKHISNSASKLLAMEGVEAVSQNTSLIDTVHTVVASLNGVMTILVLTSVLLAVVILYNLTNINIAERIRELSTIKVLGFYNKEVTLYIYRETISLSAVGIVAGLLVGKYLHQVIMDMIGSDNMQFGSQVDWYIYIIPIAAVLLILAVLGILVNGFLKKVDMLEALKSVD